MRIQVQEAIDTKLRPYVQSLGNDLILRSLVGDVATLKIIGEPDSFMRIPLRTAVSMKLQELVPGVKSVLFDD